MNKEYADEMERSKPNPAPTTPKPGLVVGCWMDRDAKNCYVSGVYIADPAAPNGMRKVER